MTSLSQINELLANPKDIETGLVTALFPIILHPLQQGDYLFVILRLMGKGALRAIPMDFATLLVFPRCSGAFLQSIQGAIAEQAVELLPHSFMAGIIFAIFVPKIAM